MALVLKLDQPQKVAAVQGQLNILTGTLTFTGTYATGGLTPDKKLANYFRAIYAFLCQQDGYTVDYDSANNKFKVYGGGEAEYDNSDTIALTAHFVVFGL